MREKREMRKMREENAHKRVIAAESLNSATKTEHSKTSRLTRPKLLHYFKTNIRTFQKDFENENSMKQYDKKKDTFCS